MLEVDIKNILPVTDARAKIATLVDEVMGGKLYVLTRGGKPAVVVVPIEMAEKVLVKKPAQGGLVASKPAQVMPVKVEIKEELPVTKPQEVEKSPTIIKDEETSLAEPELPVAPVLEDKKEEVVPAVTDNPVPLPTIEDDDDMPAIDINKINKAIEEAERD